MNNILKFEKTIKNNNSITKLQFLNNTLILYTNYLLSSDEFVSLYLAQSLTGEYILTDMGFTLQDILDNNKTEEFINTKIKNSKLNFDNKNVFTIVTLENINEMIDEFIEFIKLLGI